MPSYVIYLIRTFAPILAGWLISLPAAKPILTLLGLSDSTTAAAAVASILAAGYAALVHLLERKWPKLGVLLGIPNAPSYTAATVGFPFDTSDLTVAGSPQLPALISTTAVLPTPASVPTPVATPDGPIAPTPATPSAALGAQPTV